MRGRVAVHVLITGGTGFIGKALCEYLQGKGHTLCVLTRDVSKAQRRLPKQNIRLLMI